MSEVELYHYDGDGKRVTRQTPDATVTTFVYDATAVPAERHVMPPAFVERA